VPVVGGGARLSATGDRADGRPKGGSGWLVQVRPSLPADTPRIRRARPDDADSWVRTYLDALAATYSLLLPPEFLAQQRARASELVERYRAVFTAQRADPHRSHRAWYAEDAVGPVGIVEVRTGPPAGNSIGVYRRPGRAVSWSSSTRCPARTAPASDRRCSTPPSGQTPPTCGSWRATRGPKRSTGATGSSRTGWPPRPDLPGFTARCSGCTGPDRSLPVGSV
jgi:hypothetical protein